MGIRFSAAVAIAVILAGVAPAHGQSLADVARKEEERRKDIKDPAKVYTNKDLEPAPAPSTPPAASTTSSSADGSQAAKTDKPADKTDAKTEKGEVKDQAYWQARLKQLHETLDRDQTYGDALQSRINALTTDFVNRDDPAQRVTIERDRQKALAELDRLKKQIVADKKAIDDLQEEARRAGVPPGWLRS